MKKIFTWYFLQLKTWLKRPICWIQILGMVFLVWIIQEISIPSAENIRVGIYSLGEEAVNLQEEVVEQNSLFDFVVYSEEQQLEQDVISGKLECGFVLHENAGQNWETGQFQDTITYICTPLTSKGYIARETVFAALLRMYNGTILKAESDILLGKSDEMTDRLIQSTSNQYINSDTVFRIDTEYVERTKTQEKSGRVLPIQGIIGIIIFMTMFLGCAAKENNGMYNPAKALDSRNRLLYAFLQNLAFATPGAITGLFLLCKVQESRGIGIELLAMLILVMWGDIFLLFICMLLRVVMRNERMLAGSTVTILLLNLLVCPVFIDFAQYMPALKLLYCIFPVGIYLLL